MNFSSGTTPSGLGRPATLLMLALAALVLPLVPGLARAQTEVVQKEVEAKLKNKKLELVLSVIAGPAVYRYVT